MVTKLLMDRTRCGHIGRALRFRYVYARNSLRSLRYGRMAGITHNATSLIAGKAHAGWLATSYSVSLDFPLVAGPQTFTGPSKGYRRCFTERYSAQGCPPARPLLVIGVREHPYTAMNKYIHSSIGKSRLLPPAPPPSPGLLCGPAPPKDDGTLPT